MAEPAARIKATYEDLYTIPENMTGEIIDGEMSVTPRPSARHIYSGTRFGSVLVAGYDFGSGGPGGWIILDEPEISFGEDILVPDLAGWKKERFSVSEEHNWISVVPDWVCEIISPGTVRKDRIQKMPIYGRHDVPYVWLIDPIAKSLEIFRLESGRWTVAGLYAENDKVRAEPFEQMEINLADLWLENA